MRTMSEIKDDLEAAKADFDRRVTTDQRGHIRADNNDAMVEWGRFIVAVAPLIDELRQAERHA